MGMDPKPHGLSLVVYRCLDLLVVAVIYLTSELVVWGLSQALTLAGVPYFASIVGMVAVFATMTVLTHLFEKCDGFYHCWIKAKVSSRSGVQLFLIGHNSFHRSTSSMRT